MLALASEFVPWQACAAGLSGVDPPMHGPTPVMQVAKATLSSFQPRTETLNGSSPTVSQSYMQPPLIGTHRDRAQASSVSTARLGIDEEIALNTALQRALALTSERLERRRHELRFTVAGLALGGLVIGLLACMLIANRRYHRQLLRLADQDSLTGLPNRRRTAEKATIALSSATARCRPVTIALIDLDHFKSVNDKYGHAVGDYVLKEFARLAGSAIRAYDTLGRWGGEEFLLILPDAGLDSAVATIHRIRSATAHIEPPEAARGLHVSFSAGIATRTKAMQSLDEVIAAADVALYEAKSGGRNLVRLDRETYRAAASNVLQTLYGGGE
ncbi:MAG: GGDEF domain-containing protein [Steroidobacteraceae bacterium]